jgi:hypothetical protein
VTNLPLSGAELRGRLLQVWEANEPADLGTYWPQVTALMAQKYAHRSWHLRC